MGCSSRRRSGSALSQRPLIIAGGGVIYAEATEELSPFASRTGIPVGETQAGKGSLHADHPQLVGAMGVNGYFCGQSLAANADLVIAIGTRLGDFTTASKTAFQNPAVRFININVAEFDAFKHAALPLNGGRSGDAGGVGRRAVVVASSAELPTRRLLACVRRGSRKQTGSSRGGHGPPLSQGEVVGLLNATLGPRDIIVNAAGSLPGDLHKLWRARDPKGYHMDYGYSCMGYEVAGGLGVKMADPSREVYVLIGDGSYLMMAQEIVTSLQEKHKTQHCAVRQSWLLEHRWAEPGVRQRRIWHGVSLSRRRSHRPCHCYRLCGECRQPGRVYGEGANLRAIGCRLWRRQRSSLALLWSWWRRTTTIACRGMTPGGMCRSRKCRRTPRCKKREPPMWKR